MIIILVQDVITGIVEAAITAPLQIAIQTQIIARIAHGIGLMAIQTRIRQGIIGLKVIQLRLHLGEVAHQEVVVRQVAEAAVVVAQEDQDKLTKY